jgi:hypothetical protein
MALTKLPKAGLATGSVSASQIEDGTIQNQEFEDSTLTSAKFADSTIANAKLSNSTITLNGTSIALGASGTFFDGELVEWQSVITADGSTTTTAVAGKGYFIDTTNHAHTINLPSSASIGDTISIKDYAEKFGTNSVTIGRNGHNIQGNASDSVLQTNRALVTLVYADATKGWLFTDEHNVASLQVANHIEATGGTVSTSGDYKIHVFNSTSNFVVSQTGNNPSNPAGGPNTVSYLVVAGGGGGSKDSGGGGGAGGFREGRDIAPSYTASPLNSGSGLTITAQTYPVTVGAGGADQTGPNSSNKGNPGSDSTFSTITSAGGGGGGAGGGQNDSTKQAGLNGGSGGGGGSGPSTQGSGGSGNTPPVSPSQGNSGGNSGTGTGNAAGGGGGAGASGSNGSNPPRVGGNAGAGVASSITGSSVTRAGGGGGGGYEGGGGSAGSGGGGAGGSDSDTSTAGSANTGGGGGGGNGSSPNTGKAGGSGVVIIRYKYQN